MKTIAVDIDEVLARHNHGLALFHNQRYGTTHTEHDYFTDYWSKVWDVSEEEAERRAVEFHDAKVHARLDEVPGAFEVLNTLRHDYRLVVVSVRRRQVVGITKLWLDEHYGSIFEDVRFVHFWDGEHAKTKAEICEELDAEWLIDDSIKHVSTMAKSGRQGILFGDYSWNQADSLPLNVVRLKNWNDIQRYFDEVKNGS